MEGAKVLIVDDDVEILQLLEEHLSTRWKIITAVNGQAGLEKIESENPDVVLTDIKMPTMDGFEMVSRIREMGDDRVVVFFTTKRDANSIARSIKLRAFDFVQKPIDLQRMEIAIEIAIEEGLRFSATKGNGFDGPTIKPSENKVSVDTATLEHRKRVHDILNVATIALLASTHMQKLMASTEWSDGVKANLREKNESTISAIRRLVRLIE